MTVKTLLLIEYQALSIDKSEFSEALGEKLWQNYSKEIQIEFPSPKTNNQWKITPQGSIGHIQLSTDFVLYIQPKVPLQNIFGMLDYAYRLKSFQFLEGLTHCDSVEQIFDRLAGVLARRITERSRKGLYQTYISQTNQHNFIRGRLDLKYLVHKPWSTQLRCHYKEQTADIEDNQILLWTLRQIALRLPKTASNLQLVRQAYHSLQTTISLTPVSPRDCLNRKYHRLNDDYQTLHALCRFFLEQCGPEHSQGDRQMLPFLVNMARLYEMFIAEWLKVNAEVYLVPQNLEIKAQERVYLDESKSFHFNIDLVLLDIHSGKVRYVLDTKYKIPDAPSANDTAKIIAYATAQDCPEAVLIYPQPLSKPLNTKISPNIRVRCLTFAIDDDIEKCGQKFLQELFA
jgi:5-methylcytosine-specific restriction enzyme subunit McrC